MPQIDVDGGYAEATPLSGGEVSLIVPASPEYLRLVRLTAAGLASRMGFTFDEVEDLRIAVDELCHLLVAGVASAASLPDGDHTIELRYVAGRDSIRIEGSTDLDGALPEPNELSLQILTALVDDVTLRSDEGRAGFVLVKQRESI